MKNEVLGALKEKYLMWYEVVTTNSGWYWEYKWESGRVYAMGILRVFGMELLRAATESWSVSQRDDKMAC
jgi:hypothetical protein